MSFYKKSVLGPETQMYSLRKIRSSPNIIISLSRCPRCWRSLLRRTSQSLLGLPRSLELGLRLSHYFPLGSSTTNTSDENLVQLSNCPEDNVAYMIHATLYHILLSDALQCMILALFCIIQPWANNCTLYTHWLFSRPVWRLISPDSSVVMHFCV